MQFSSLHIPDVFVIEVWQLWQARATWTPGRRRLQQRKQMAPTSRAVIESENVSILIVYCPLALGTVGLGRQ